MKSIVSKSIIFLSCATLLLSAVLIITSYYRERDIYFQQLTTSVPELVQNQLNQQKEEIESTIEKVEANPEAYKTDQVVMDMQNNLEVILNNPFFANSYLLDPTPVQKDGKNIVIVKLTNKALTEAGATPGFEYEVSPEFFEGFQTASANGELNISATYVDVYGKWMSVFAPIKNSSGEIICILGFDLDVAKIEGDLNKLLVQNILIGLVISLILVAIMIVMIRRMLRPIQTLSKLTLQAAQGNLGVDIEVKSSDEIGILSKNFNIMLQQLKQLLEQLRLTGGQVQTSTQTLSVDTDETTNASRQITTAIHEMASGIEKQLEGTEESARAMEEMAIGITRIAETASVVANSSHESVKEANQGNELIQKAVHQMSAIKKSVGDSAVVIQQLGDRSKEIGQIVEVITNIASQTNLLALNAAIEAARAGEHGRGFAVVADEVRKLAEQSENSAHQIANLIELIQDNTQQAVDVMGKGLNEVQTGTTVVNEVGEAFGRIVRAAQDTSSQIEEVLAISEEMSAGTEQVAASVETMAQIAKQSSISAQNVVSASNKQANSIQNISVQVSSLAEMSEELNSLIKKFTL
ncbi:methyl-accepting chemotaxis protein [Brevibacillus dissolubilis]|uniref:methyl-accepting chemotaxis protein n=1 Tax=Brevibacillus dissolubilis TaxID=1844116 RepID=UPI00159BC28E|nr:methyl-accepting chemotaxis protein [Brevibacillus dissolubilis]